MRLEQSAQNKASEVQTFWRLRETVDRSDIPKAEKSEIYDWLFAAIPKKIRTIAEGELLPVRSVIRDIDGDVWTKYSDGWMMLGDFDESENLNDSLLPATLLFMPGHPEEVPGVHA